MLRLTTTEGASLAAGATGQRQPVGRCAAQVSCWFSLTDVSPVLFLLFLFFSLVSFLFFSLLFSCFFSLLLSSFSVVVCTASPRVWRPSSARILLPSSFLPEKKACV